jgi:hypothetical protein
MTVAEVGLVPPNSRAALKVRPARSSRTRSTVAYWHRLDKWRGSAQIRVKYIGVGNDTGAVPLLDAI